MAKIPDIAIETVEMHTGGEPVRIVTSGYPTVEGATLLDKRRFARERLDHLRTFLMHEPRGHAGMYGALPVAPDHPDADLAVLFLHNEGDSTMCGHAVIALARWAVDTGIVPRRRPETPVAIQCPCGLVRARALDGPDGAVGETLFDSVPAFALHLDAAVTVDGIGEVILDVAYGGAFYALVPAARLGLDLRTAPLRAVVDRAAAVSQAVASQLPIRHPEDDDLSFLYGTIVTDGGEGAAAPSLNVCVFAGRQVDRSPTGSGVTARLAALAARDPEAARRMHRFGSLTGAVFTGRAIGETSPGGNKAGTYPAMTVEVGGRSHYSGTARFTADADDLLATGFLLDA